MATVTTGRLLGSVLLSLVTLVLVGTLGSLVVLDQFEPGPPPASPVRWRSTC